MTKDQIQQLIIDHILKILPGLPSDMVTPDKYLNDLGANSIDRMDIVTMTADSLGLRIPMVELAGAKTIHALIELFHASINGSTRN